MDTVSSINLFLERDNMLALHNEEHDIYMFPVYHIIELVDLPLALE